MEHLIIPQNYTSALSLHDTQVAIKTVKDFFQDLLSERLNLQRVSRSEEHTSELQSQR